MPRGSSIVVRVTLAALLILLVGWLGMVGLLIWSTMGPDPEAVLAKAQPTCDAIIVALDEYHRRHGRYPQALDDLVINGLQPAVPELPPHWGTSSRSGPEYAVNLSLDFYRLTYGYCVEGGIGPGKYDYREFVSDDGLGWRPMSHVSMEDVVADRLLTMFRKKHDSRSLNLFMSDVIGKADCAFLYRDRVVKWLGPGAEVQVPQDVPGAGKTGSAYHAEDDPSTRYCFVYKNHWLPVLKENLSASDREKAPGDPGTLAGAFVDTNYPILDKLLRVEESGGRTLWTVIRECPISPRDRPANPTIGPS